MRKVFGWFLASFSVLFLSLTLFTGTKSGADETLVGIAQGSCGSEFSLLIAYYDTDGDPTQAEFITYALPDETVFAVAYYEKGELVKLAILQPDKSIKTYASLEGVEPPCVIATILLAAKGRL
jgi:hypothetical protein